MFKIPPFVFSTSNSRCFLANQRMFQDEPPLFYMLYIPFQKVWINTLSMIYLFDRLLGLVVPLLRMKVYVFMLSLFRFQF